MSTTQTTSGTNSSNLSFNPTAESMYNQLISGGGNVLSGYINNPFGNSAYTMGAQQSQAGAQQAGQNNMNSLMQNMKTSGLSGQGGAGFKQAQMAQTGRANQSMSSQANIQNVMQALQRQMQASATGLSFSPQLTGQSGQFSQQQSSSGLGTWLPQLLGAGLSLGTMGSTAGASAGGGASAMSQVPSFGSGPNSNFMNSLNNPFQMAGMGSSSFMGSGGGNSYAPSPLLAGMTNPFQSN